MWRLYSPGRRFGQRITMRLFYWLTFFFISFWLSIGYIIAKKRTKYCTIPSDRTWFVLKSNIKPKY